MVGHVDHGKTTITKALTGIWTDKHSEELRRGITIRLGYADTQITQCEKCKTYGISKECKKCKGKTKLVRRISLVDAPGHETLMAVMISGSAIMDGAILVIAANEKCPQPQTYEHLMALDIVDVKNILIVQNKVDLVTKEKALENYKEIKEFIKGTVAENAPIIPLAANQEINVDALAEAIEEFIPTPERDTTKPARMFVARSFDINKPNSPIEKLKGGVVGGSLIEGKLKVGDTIEIRPGINVDGKYRTITTKVTGLNTCGKDVKEALPGGLLGVATELDPALTKTDMLVGSICGKEGTLPDVLNEIDLEVTLMDRVVGVDKVTNVIKGEMLLLNIGTGTTLGTVTSLKPVHLNLKRPVCAEKGWKAAVGRRIGNRWRLIGYGTII